MGPAVTAWVEERRDLPRPGGQAAQVGSLVRVAMEAARRQVCEQGRATVLPGGDVVDLEVRGNVGGAALAQIRETIAVLLDIP